MRPGETVRCLFCSVRNRSKTAGSPSPWPSAAAQPAARASRRIGKTGNGFGVDVGFYDPLVGAVEIDHDVDGRWILDVFAVNVNTIELYDPRSDTSYYLRGFRRSNFDYDLVFYDNIEYFLQEYNAWEKVYTSEEGAINDFDDENFLQFFPDFFRSSVDGVGTPINNLQWDYEGNYQVYDVPNDETLKTLTLDYDFLGNDYFELYVIDDSTIELYHPSSETVYEFRGRGYIQYLKSGTSSTGKKRTKTKNPVMNVRNGLWLNEISDINKRRAEKQASKRK